MRNIVLTAILLFVAGYYAGNTLPIGKIEEKMFHPVDVSFPKSLPPVSESLANDLLAKYRRGDIEITFTRSSATEVQQSFTFATANPPYNEFPLASAVLKEKQTTIWGQKNDFHQGVWLHFYGTRGEVKATDIWIPNEAVGRDPTVQQVFSSMKKAGRIVENLSLIPSVNFVY